MQRDTDKFISRTVIVSGLVAILAIGGLIFAQYHAFPELTQLRFNAYALLSATSFVGTLAILIRTFLRGGRSEESKWFMLAMLELALFSGSEMMQRLSVTPTAAIFWGNLCGAGTPLAAVALYLFALAYTKPDLKRQNILTTLLLVASTVIALFYGGSLIYDQAPSHIHHFAWGLNNLPGNAYVVPIAFIFYMGTVAGYIVLRFRHRTDNQLLKKQSLLFGIAILAPVFGGIVFDGLLPILGVDSLPPLTSVFELVTVLLIYYGISNYQLFRINPAILAENVLTTMQEGVVVTRADFGVEYINKEAERLLGMQNEKLSQKTYLHAFFTPDSWPKVHDYIEGKMAASDELGDVAILGAEGEKVPVRVFASRLQDEGVFQAYVFVISDITDIVASYDKLENDSIRISGLLDEAHKLEHQLEEEKAGVEHVVEVRTKELRTAQEKLKETDKIKSEFISLASHNLRTPLTVIANGLEMLKSTPTDEDRQKFVRSIEHGTIQLKSFVEDMVMISSIEAGGDLQSQPVSARSMLDPLVTDYSEFVNTKPGLEFQADLRDTDTELNVNKNQIEGAIKNIVGNAFKFTESGHIKLSSRRDGDHFIIEVSDTGIGIAPNQVHEIFTKFHRATDTLQYDYEGEGIGLYLSKLIIEEHGGTIDVRSKLEEGSTFTITLPLKQASTPAS